VTYVNGDRGDSTEGTSEEDLVGSYQRQFGEFWVLSFSAVPVRMLRIGKNGGRKSGRNWLTRVYPENGR